MNTFESIKNSMLWAAYGDALGFITELSDVKRLKYRTRGLGRVKGLIGWRRKLGGQYGVSIELPEGVYSDDTQLRLAVCRSIRKDGEFDFETFSKIEIPVFLAYGLGMGKGTKAAAESLKKKTVQWNTNFFKTPTHRYTDVGGNGAAMRIQPHVWTASSALSDEALIREIIRDSIITHGHPVGWVGAVFHGLILRQALIGGECPPPDIWDKILTKAKLIVNVCKEDKLLNHIWLPSWEKQAQTKLESAVEDTIDEMMGDIKTTNKILQETGIGLLREERDKEERYRSIAENIDAFNPAKRGSATKTALLATYIAYFFSGDPAKGIEICANTLDSDTDTIATMAGAILGTYSNSEPPQRVLDYDYLVSQAERLYEISCGRPKPQFFYPDLLHWNLPKSTIDFVGQLNNKEVALYGLGIINPLGEAITQKNATGSQYWRFYKASFNQTLLLKHREKLSNISPQSVPPNGIEDESMQLKDTFTKSEGVLINETPHFWPTRPQKQTQTNLPLEQGTLDRITDHIIKNGFNEKDIGKQLLSYAAEEDGLEKAIGFASIIVKAKKARLRK